MKLSIHFCLHNKLFVILLFCGMDFLDIGPDGHEKIYRYRLVNDMSGKDILFLSSSPLPSMATCKKDRKHIVSALVANKDGKL